MAFIPKDAKWYLAAIVEQITVEDDPRHVVHINMILIRANSPEEAYQESLKIGANYNQAYENPEGKTVTFRFLGLNNLTAIDGELEHGAELSYQKFSTTDEATIRDRIKSKEDLTVAVSANVAGAAALAPFAGAVIITTGATGTITVTLTGADVDAVPLLPVAFAVMEYEPAATLAQVKLYGAVASALKSVKPL